MEGSLKRILIIDDEESVRTSLALLLKETYHVEKASSAEDALVLIHREPHPDAILLDVLLPGTDGISLLKQIREIDPKIPVLMLTGAGSVRGAVHAMQQGAVNYLNKPFDIGELKEVLAAAVASQREANEGASKPTRVVTVDADFGPMVGKSAAMVSLFEQIDTIASRDSTVLITGESGTGKELVARQIHARSSRKNGPFIALNCASIPESLIESELFGHEKGAFTHAVERRLGQFELADGGTLFLDEIGELSPAVQVKLLRFLQEQEFYRVGRSKPIRVDVRIVTATNKDLEHLVRQGTFRQDLFYRINVINLALAPLRDRHEDVEPLINNFVARLSRQYGGRELSFTPEAKQLLISYNWPGNVRELGNVVESILALCASPVVTEQDLPKKIRERISTSESSPQSFASGLAFEEAERMFETEMIVKALKRANFVQVRAAEMLGISRRILKYKMDKLKINERGEVLSDTGPQDS
ncbi:MAG: Acetoacetate metabolism regulatory protein AtoC [Pseudomonadota bacterium]